LDESLIGLVTPEERNELLDEVRPPYVVLKPSFVGGWRGTQDWIERAEARGMEWWITSALEGSIGLNAVAQDVARRAPLARAQGLGTGGLYTNNLPPWTELRGEQLHYTAPYPAEVGSGPWPENLRIHPQTDPQLIQETQAFLRAWYGPSDRLEFTTSGSTGTPKTVRLPKKLLVASARATLDTLNLAPGYTSLLALSPTRIGGAMVLIRALVGQGTVDLASVQRNPLEGWDTPDAPWDFCSLVPQQALALAESAATHNTLKNQRASAPFKTLLLGGAHCTPADARRIAPLAQQIYLGFGMTETASHIALAKLQPDNPRCCTPDGRWIYTPVRGVSLVWPQSATEIPSLEPVPLTFAAPHLGLEEPLETTDAVLPNGAGFAWCGRLDGALNSAGVKIFPEQVELWVGQRLPNLEGRGFLTAVADPHWGDRLVWLSEPLTAHEQTELRNAWRELRREHPHWVPKSTGELAEWPRAAQGKIDRAALRRAAEHASASRRLIPVELPHHD
jgi:O-succinylbenzoic acid--CoA ligase